MQQPILQYISGDSMWCKDCNSTKKKSFYPIHRASQHQDETFYKLIKKCEECNIFFASNTRLNNHNKIKHIGLFKLLFCDECTKKFKSKINLKQHIRTEHKDKKEGSCTICGKNFIGSVKLKLHLKHSHKPAACENCHKTFQAKASLIKHKKMHVKV